MADKIEVQPQEIEKTGTGSEQVELQKLDDATGEPRASVEQTGNYRQAEAIQGNFVALMGNTANAAADTSAQAPQSGALAATSDSTLENTASAAGDSSDQAPVSEAQPAPAIPEREVTVASQQPSIVKGVFEDAPGKGDGTGDDFSWETHEFKLDSAEGAQPAVLRPPADES
jgi:hypothetical protein